MLFKDSIKLQEFAEINNSVNFATVKPSLERIEALHITAILGSTLYKSLNDAYTAASNESSLSDIQKALLLQCRKVIGPLLGYYYAPIGELKFSDAGIRREETATTKTAYQYQITNYREACLRNGEAAEELLFEFLEEKKADYSEWVSSPSFTSYRSLFIKSGKEFNEFFTSHSPYRNYWAMRSKMVDVEELHIRKVIGSATFDALKTKSKQTTPGFTSKETELLFKLKKAIANLTVSLAVPLLSVRIDANGITVVNSGPRTNRDQDALLSNAPDNNISNLIKSTADSGSEWLKSAIQFLNDNASDFSTWTVPDSTDDTELNDSLKGSFALL